MRAETLAGVKEQGTSLPPIQPPTERNAAAIEPEQDLGPMPSSQLDGEEGQEEGENPDNGPMAGMSDAMDTQHTKQVPDRHSIASGSSRCQYFPSHLEASKFKASVPMTVLQRAVGAALAPKNILSLDPLSSLVLGHDVSSDVCCIEVSTHWH